MISRGMHIYLLSVAGAAILVVLLLIIFLHPVNPAKPVRKEIYLNPAINDFPYSRIKIPEEKLNLFGSDPVAIREKRTSWSAAEAERFWIPVEPLIADLLKEENKRLVNDIFNDVP